MDLFTYLLGKKGKNSLVHKGDLFAYLLGKRTPKEVKTASGTTISISDVTSTKIVSLTLSKESTQDGTPTPENPVEVKTVKGYRNLFDEDNVTFTIGTLDDNGQPTSSTASHYTNEYYDVKPNTNFTIKGTLRELYNQYAIYFYDINKQWISKTSATSLTPYTFLTPNNCYYIRIQVPKAITLKTHDVMLNEGTEELPYVLYGNNWIYTAVSNGTDTNYYTIPLNDNEIAGIGSYKDELIVDSDGHCWLNKKFPKKIFTENDNWIRQSVYTNNTRYVLNDTNVVAQIGTQILSNYFLKGKGGTDTINIDMNGGNGWLMITIPNTIAPTLVDFKNWLQTKYNEDNPVYALYVTTTPQLIDLNYTVDLTLFEGINNISNSDDMDMTLKYY